MNALRASAVSLCLMASSSVVAQTHSSHITPLHFEGDAPAAEMRVRYDQVEHVPVVHPVYDFLARASVRGMLGDFSLASLPLQRKEIAKALAMLAKVGEEQLGHADMVLLKKYCREFLEYQTPSAAVVLSPSDSTQILFDYLLSDNVEKYLYHYEDSTDAVSVVPLGSLEYRKLQSDSAGSAVLGQVGFRLYGTISGHVGYLLQLTNGSVLGGERRVALHDPTLRRNVKFGELNSDFDFTESHVRVDYDRFYAIIGRETRLAGAGYFNHMLLSNGAPTFDAVTVGARFERFDYRFMHGGLLAQPLSGATSGATVVIPSKYFAMHRFAFHDTWGELAITESVVYSERGADLAYLNPLSFFKSIEHAQRDRDNPALAFDATVRPVNGVEIRGSFYLDDLRFEKIGTDYWGNKSAWNIGAMYASDNNVDFAAEYAVVYPYTFSHFNSQNAVTNDGLQMSGSIPPNSDRLSAMLRWWWGQRYPIVLTVSSLRHGRNMYDSEGALLHNVGGDIHQTRRWEDSENAPFLDGDLEHRFAVELQGGVELVRGFSMRVYYGLMNTNGVQEHEGRVGLFYEHF